MHTHQEVLHQPAGLAAAIVRLETFGPDLVLVFAAPGWFREALLDPLARAFPNKLAGCSSGGQIWSKGLEETSCVITALRFQGIRCQLADAVLGGPQDSFPLGQRLGAGLASLHPRQVLVFSPGIAVDGSALVHGLQAALPDAQLSGGLAGDEGLFEQTWTLGPSGIASNRVVAVALGGPLQVGHGCYGGWKPFGPTRKATACEGNLLLELDHQPALDVYQRYLGDYAQGLPASALLFPMAVLNMAGDDSGLIRTILGIDEARRGLILAGSVEQGVLMRLMHANTDALVDGAEQAGRAAFAGQNQDAPRLALLVTCIGRKLVMGDRTEDEIEAVAATGGPHTLLTGFYSFGEISPGLPTVGCQLHNQTMAITALSEACP
jgi:hypothetical protein